MPPLVLKIGGSLVAQGGAREVLDLVAGSPRQIVVVPGGGAYADAVRADQVTLGFSDAQAHRLAIFAMQRMALDFQEMQPKLLAVDSIEAMHRAWAVGRIPVWLPWAMVEHEANIAQDWSLTSDGLAAWLAAQLGGAEVALIKSCAIPSGASLNSLVTAGITDTQFPAFVAQAKLNWHVLGKNDGARLGAILGGRVEA